LHSDYKRLLHNLSTMLYSKGYYSTWNFLYLIKMETTLQYSVFQWLILHFNTFQYCTHITGKNSVYSSNNSEAKMFPCTGGNYSKSTYNILYCKLLIAFINIWGRAPRAQCALVFVKSPFLPARLPSRSGTVIGNSVCLCACL